MGETKKLQKKHHTWMAEARDILRDAETLQKAIDVMEGKCLPIRDMADRIIGQSDPPTLDQRIAMIKTLLSKIMPDLRSVEVDAKVDATGGMQLLVLPVQPPASVNADVIDAEMVEPPSITDQTPVSLDTRAAVRDLAPADTPDAAPTRRRRRRTSQ